MRVFSGSLEEVREKCFGCRVEQLWVDKNYVSLLLLFNAPSASVQSPWNVGSVFAV